MQICTPARRAAALLSFLLALGAAAPAPASRLSTSRPRLFLRADDAVVGLGPTVSEVRARQRHPDLEPYASLSTADASWEALLTPALQALLHGDAAAQARVRDWLLEPRGNFARSSARQGPGHAAVAFDWLYESLSPVERQRAAAQVRAGTEAALLFLRTGRPDINHNFTYMALFSVLATGLALHDVPGFEASAAEYLSVAMDWLEGPGGVYEAAAARGGAWPEGSQYSFTECTRLLVWMLQALRSATDDDPFAAIRVGHGDFLRGTARFYVAMTRPDFTLERLGDLNQFKALLRDQHRCVLEALAAGLRRDGGEPDTPALLAHFSDLVHARYGGRDTHRNFNWAMILWGEPDAPRDAVAYAAQPLLQVFGRGTMDLVVVRHGWDEDGTMITFQAGDHYADHQHFDKGAFTLYHRGALAIDSGAYDKMYSAHHRNWATRTVAHNAPLVFDPGLTRPADYANDGGQRVLRGLQHHARWSDFLAHRDAEHLDAADLRCAEHGRAPALAAAEGASPPSPAPFAGWAVAQAELAGAYGPGVRSLRRTLAYWPAPQVVVVHDDFDLTAPLEVAFQLHTQKPPQAAGAGVPVPGDTLLGPVPWWLVDASGTIDLGIQRIRYDGRLFLRTLAPAAATVRRIGGPGFEWRLNGVNHKPAGNAGAPREAGAWRIQVQPARAAARTRLIHALQLGDASLFQMVPARALEGGEGWSGAHVSGAPEAALMVASGGRGHLPLRYDIDAALPCLHLVVGLEPGALVEVRSGTVVRRLRVSDEGIVAFEDRGIGAHTVSVQPAAAATGS
jgi:hypothetical protein